MTDKAWVLSGLGVVLVLLAWAALQSARVVREEGGSDVMRDILELIHAGAVAFAKRQYALLARVTLITAAILAVLGAVARTGEGWKIALAYVAGVVLAGLAGHLGMLISTRANARTTNLAAFSRQKAFRIAFQASSVMGLVTAGVTLLGLCGGWVVLADPILVAGLVLGISTFGLFARVGGGIFAKATDVGSGLALRMEGGLPEDDLKNPGVIADQIGDNVGGVTGLGADVAESLAGATIAAMTFAATMGGDLSGRSLAVLPMIVGVLGLLGSGLGQSLVRALPNAGGRATFRYGTIPVGIVVSFGVLCFLLFYLPGSGESGTRYLGFLWTSLAGWVCGLVLAWLARTNVSRRRKSARLVAEATIQGPSLDLLRGFAVGLRSVGVPSLLLAALVGLSYYLGSLTGVEDAGWFSVSLALVGMLSQAAFQISVGAYGPIADNAYDIAKMAEAPSEVVERTRELDGLGKSAAAAARGYAGAAAALTSIVLIVAYFQVYRSEIGLAAARALPRFDLLENPALMIGLLLGGLLPYLFSSFTLTSVFRVATLVMREVRRQFREIPGLRGGSSRPDLATCVSLAIHQAHKGMATTALLALAVPTLVGLVSPMALGGVLVGAALSGFLLSTTMVTAGGIWDAARQVLRQSCAAGTETWQLADPGESAGEVITPDVLDRATVAHLLGDPLKESSGPAINSLIKLMSITALVLAPVFASLH